MRSPFRLPFFVLPFILGLLFSGGTPFARDRVFDFPPLKVAYISSEGQKWSTPALDQQGKRLRLSQPDASLFCSENQGRLPRLKEFQTLLADQEAPAHNRLSYIESLRQQEPSYLWTDETRGYADYWSVGFHPGPGQNEVRFYWDDENPVVCILLNSN